jgi:hypothetical protein
MQKRRRLIDIEIIPGVSVTRLHTEMENPMLPDNSTELHVAHHADGDIKEPAQWYNFYEHPSEHQIELVRKTLKINREDWKILEHMLGSFRWVIYRHSDPSEIKVDVAAMKDGEWTTAYF